MCLFPQGLYRNPETGSSMPIPEAMNKGLILVEYSNKKVEAGELIKRGFIRTTTSLEVITYCVKVRGTLCVLICVNLLIYII